MPRESLKMHWKSDVVPRSAKIFSPAAVGDDYSATIPRFNAADVTIPSIICLLLLLSTLLAIVKKGESLEAQLVCASSTVFYLNQCTRDGRALCVYTYIYIYLYI